MGPERNAPETSSASARLGKDAEASMGPERNAPETLPRRMLCFTPKKASMGPERNAPETRQLRNGNRHVDERFNGAGAECSGNLHMKQIKSETSISFNGAGAECSGNPEGGIGSVCEEHASMGPERNAPETKHFFLDYMKF